MTNVIKKIFFIIILYWLFSCLASAQDSTRFSVQKIHFYGNHRYSNNKLIELTKKVNFTVQNLEHSIEQILTQYKRDGYFFTEIDSIVLIFNNSSSKVDLKYFINEGSKLYNNNIILNCDNTVLKEILESLIDFRSTYPADLQLAENLEKMVTYLENNGYPFCRITIDSLVVKDYHELVTHSSVYSGPLIQIDKIKITGNKITKDNVIIREIGIGLGDRYDQRKVSKVPKRLLKLGFFNKIDEPQILINQTNKSELLLNVVEGNMNRADGVVGYVPSRGEQKGFFTGLIDIALANLLGTGRRIEAYWERKDLKTQQLRFGYQEPWLLGFPIHVGGTFQQLIQDSSYIKRNWTLDFSLPISENLVVFTNIGKENISPDSIGSIIWKIPKSRSWLINLGLTYDTRNDPINPNKGILYQTTLELSRKQISTIPGMIDSLWTASSFNRKRMTLAAELLIPTFKWQTISVALNGQQVTSNEPEISVSDMFRFGGSKSVRGYYEDEFWGSQIAWINTEYRYLLASQSRVFLFFDSGYYTRKILSGDKIENYKFGYGFGIRLDTRLGIVGIDYGLAKGRGLFDGLVHVRLINRF